MYADSFAGDGFATAVTDEFDGLFSVVALILCFPGAFIGAIFAIRVGVGVLSLTFTADFHVILTPGLFAHLKHLNMGFGTASHRDAWKETPQAAIRANQFDSSLTTLVM